jgi:hypothetical protein
VTIAATAAALNAVYTRWQETSATLRTEAAGTTCFATIEPLPEAIYKRSPSSNALGLQNRSGPLVVVLLQASYASSAQDAVVMSAMQTFVSNLIADTKALGAYDSWVYVNYAAPMPYQDPIGSYGAVNVARLENIRATYDPKKVFTHLMPGGFKLPG